MIEGKAFMQRVEKEIRQPLSPDDEYDVTILKSSGSILEALKYLAESIDKKDDQALGYYTHV